MKLSFLFYFATIVLFSCKKEQQQFNESLFADTWVKGPYASDTLWFGKKNDRPVLSYNASFNAGSPVVAYTEYNYKNGKLELKRFYSDDKTFYPIESFTWKDEGKEFEIRAIELFSFISSTNSRFLYKKVN